MGMARRGRRRAGTAVRGVSTPSARPKDGSQRRPRAMLNSGGALDRPEPSPIRGRDARYRARPAQIRTSPTKASGVSDAKRASGHGWRISGLGSQSSEMRVIRIHVVPLAAALQRASPKVDHMVPESLDRPTVGGHRKVREVPRDDLTQPFPLFRDGLMPAAA